MNDTGLELWAPTRHLRKWERERAEFLEWEPWQPVSYWKRRQFEEWYDERSRARPLQHGKPSKNASADGWPIPRPS